MVRKTLFVFALATAVNLSYSGISHAAFSYVGSEGCSSCHKIATLSWEMSAHAQTFETLKPGARSKEKLKAKLDPNKDYTTDKDCLKCHTIGYNEAGGFQDVTSTPAMVGVGCESCHGPGSDYKFVHATNKNFTKEEAKAAGQVYGSQDAAVCSACHVSKDTPMTPKIDKKYKFDYKKSIANRKSYHTKEPKSAP